MSAKLVRAGEAIKTHRKDSNFYPYYTIKGINYFATTQIIPYGIFMLKRQEAGRPALLAAVMPSKGDGAGTDTF